MFFLPKYKLVMKMFEPGQGGAGWRAWSPHLVGSKKHNSAPGCDKRCNYSYPLSHIIYSTHKISNVLNDKGLPEKVAHRLRHVTAPLMITFELEDCASDTAFLSFWNASIDVRSFLCFCRYENRSKHIKIERSHMHTSGNNQIYLKQPCSAE